jgi:hypothetical protein
MFSVVDMPATVRWYEAIGFTVEDRYEEDLYEPSLIFWQPVWLKPPSRTGPS